MSKKRGQNEGSIYYYKRLSKWAAQISLEGRRSTKYFQTKREATEWRKKMLDQIDSGLSWKGVNSTVGEFMPVWLDACKIRLKPNTIYDYTGYVRRHIIPSLGRIKIAELTPTDIQIFYNSKIKDGVGSATINNIHSVLHRALNQAVKWGYIGRNPASVVEKPRPARVEMKIWDETEVISFLSSIENTLYEGLFYLAVTTGMRKGELLGLKWQDLDWKSGELQIKRQLRYIPGEGLKFQDPKTSSSKRVILLGKSTLAKLRKHKELNENVRQFAGDNWEEHDLLFTSSTGKPIRPDNIYRIFKMLSRKIGLPEIRFHDLRHTAATLLLKQGIHPKIVQERLGHADIAITLNIYSHVTPSLQKDAAAKIDEILTPSTFEDVFSFGNVEN